MRIEGSSVLIVGGASGLGAATARTLAAAGAEVTIADRSVEFGESLADEIGAGFREVDVTDSDQVAECVQLAAQRPGGLRAALCCASISAAERTATSDGPHSYQPFIDVLSVNLIGTFNVLRLAADAMTRNDPDPDGERGVIVMTSSIAAYEGQVGQLAYAASKAGIVGMTLPAARDLARFGVRVASIAPGLFDTPQLTGMSRPAREALEATIPFPSRLGRPQEFAMLAEAILRNPMLNGEVIRLDGAIRMAPQ